MRLSKRGTVNWTTTFQTTTPDNVPMSRDEFRHLLCHARHQRQPHRGRVVRSQLAHLSAVLV